MMTDEEAYELVNCRIKPLLQGRPDDDVFLIVGFMMGLCQCILADGVGGTKAVEIICRAAVENETGTRLTH